jgi:hypothetical protein
VVAEIFPFSTKAVGRVAGGWVGGWVGNYLDNNTTSWPILQLREIAELRFPKFKLMLRLLNYIVQFFKLRRPPIEEDLRVVKVQYLSWIILEFSNFLNPQNEDDLQWKTASNGRQPKNIKSGKS